MQRILFLQGLCDEVDDAVQDVFFKVFRAQLPEERRFLAWFYRVIINTGRDHGRHRRARRSLIDRLGGTPHPSAAAPPAEPVEPHLREALCELSAELRECVALRFFADLSLEEIASIQEIPLGTVKSRLHTAMKRLRQSLTSGGLSPHDD